MTARQILSMLKSEIKLANDMADRLRGDKTVPQFSYGWECRAKALRGIKEAIELSGLRKTKTRK